MKEISEAGRTVLEARYLRRDSEGKVVESPDEMFRRVAVRLAEAEKDGKSEWSDEFYQVMASLDFLPNSPTLANAGKNNLSLSACYVLPVEDSMEGIFESVKNAALIHQTGGGTGFSFSRLRPSGALVSSTGHAASGPVSFMRVFDAATNAIKQGGMRRGANMGMLRCDHPDIREFIHCKDDGQGIVNFNISVLITSEFMNALQGNGYCGGYSYPLLDPQVEDREKALVGFLDAREIWDEICESAWRTGDPGVVFIDRVNESRANPVNGWKVESTNPCGEQPLYPYDSCNLGSINLGNFVKRLPDCSCTTAEHYCESPIDWERLAVVTKVAVRMLDNVITVNHYVIPQIKEVTEGVRRIGLGVMGWADMLIQLGVPYASDEAVALGEKVAGFIQDVADAADVELAGEKGTFPLWGKSIYEQSNIRLRNSTRTTIAPTGTISLIAGASSGIEPLFALSFEHGGLEGAMKGKRIGNPYVEAYIDGLRDKAWDRFVDGEDEVLKTAHEIDPIWHIRHQAAWQKHVDNAVSKTINLPNSATVDDIRECYEKAYEMGCMGVTVFRNGCRSSQVLMEVKDGSDDRRRVSLGASSSVHERGVEDDGTARSEDTSNSSGSQMERRGVTNRAPRPTSLPSRTYQQPTPFGNMYVIVTERDGQPYELFATIGKAGSDVQAMAEGLGRVSSKYLQAMSGEERRGVFGEIARQLSGIGGSGIPGLNKRQSRSIPDGIATVINTYLEGGEDDRAGNSDLSHTSSSMATVTTHTMNLCIDCGRMGVVMESGCSICKLCGWSTCG